MHRAVIIGATGFGGLGLIEILLRHPGIEISQLVARKDTGKPVSEVFPHLRGFCDLQVETNDSVDLDSADIAFFSTPDRAGMTLIREYYEKGIPVIDFSGDFRFSNTEDYSVYAKNKGMDQEHFASDILAQCVYGLPEKNRDLIRNARIVGNPGCFAISMILGLLPAVQENIITSDRIICDGKTGVSGAGKASGEANLYPQRHENINTYREGRHQHLVEVENVINSCSDMDKRVLFIPQVVPLNRGILMTMYADISREWDTERVSSLYSNYYSKDPFVIITDRSPGTADVRGSNRCEIRPLVDERTGTLVVTTVIDNLIKGQSGNAVQNANIILGMDETAGLDIPAFYP